MIVNSTELQNNFGKYLMFAVQEDIIITRNGLKITQSHIFVGLSAELDRIFK